MTVIYFIPILVNILIDFIIFCNMIVQAEFLCLQHPCGYCGTPSIRDVLPLELSPVCDWFPSQAPALQSLFSSPSAVVQQSDFIKYFLSTPSNWCFLCCTRSNFRLVQQTKISTQRSNRRTRSEILFSSSWRISLLIRLKILCTDAL